ncbi:MAG: hypothetical protein JWP88_1323 [Flaviaesturariibacter sp.]|nr:hypothetical protein [Flaviaesturariibacter sp.]
MTLNKLLLSTLLVLLAFTPSCKKELKKIKGRYNGTARYVLADPQNPARNKDTLYNNVSLEVKEGSESSRKQLTVEITNSAGTTSFNTNIPVNNGVVNYTRTTVQAGVYYRWVGEIKNDSLKLSQKTEDTYRNSYNEWIFRAKK